MNKSLLTASLEAVAYQSPIFFKELTLIFSEVMSAGALDNNSLSKSRLSKFVADPKRGLNLKVSFILDDNTKPAAWIHYPELDVNHPLLNDVRRQYSSNEQGKFLARTNKMKKALGGVDRVQSKVTGDFAEVAVNAHITRGLLSGNFTAEEVAAIVLHELGHVFTYFECLGETLTTNYALTEAVRQFIGTADLKQRFEILTELDLALGVKLEGKEDIATVQNGEVLQAIVLKDYIDTKRSELGSSMYDENSWEYLSDQFAARHGAAVPLANALDKIYKAYGDKATYGTIRYSLMEIFKVSGFLLLTAANPAMGVFLLLSIGNPNRDLYDKPSARIARIEREMIGQLKDQTLPAELRAALVEEIKVVQALQAKLEDRDTFYQALFTFVSPWTRGQKRKLKDQQQLEQLANNSLYVTAAELQAHS